MPQNFGTSKPLICAIAAMDSARVIGHKNDLPNWDIPEDMDHLHAITKGCPLIMGRATHESICTIRGIDPKTNAAMPGRYNVVITRDTNYFGEHWPNMIGLASSPKDGLNLAYDFALQAGIEKVFIFGGEQIYTALLPQTERLYLTEVEGLFKGDAHFPMIDMNEWQRIAHEPCDNGKHKFAFNIYDRIKP